MSREYTEAAKYAFIESLSLRAVEMAYENGNVNGITEKAVLASIGTTLISMGQQHLIAAAMMESEEDSILRLDSEHPYIKGSEAP